MEAYYDHEQYSYGAVEQLYHPDEEDGFAKHLVSVSDTFR